MKRIYMICALLLMGATVATGSASAEGFLLGEETKGATISANGTDLSVRIRLQPRIDYGDIIKSKDGKSYASDKDIYLRRARLELSGSLIAKTVKYNLTLSADKWSKDANTDAVKLHYAYVEWAPSDALAVMIGKEKLPFSRVSLTSSTLRPVIENPVSTEDAKKLFGVSTSDPYYQPKLAVKGRALDGIVAYEAAVADGWQAGEAVEAGRTVYRASPLIAARAEFSPPGYAEEKKSDSPLGKGRHLTLGVDAAAQSNIEYKENGSGESRSLWGVDLSGHYKAFSALLEYNQWKVSSTDPSVASVKPRGWFVQAAYFIDGPNIEPAARYEVYDQDSSSSGKKERITTAGLNWYLKGNSLKTSLDWVHARFDGNAAGRLSNDAATDVYQLQVQLYY